MRDVPEMRLTCDRCRGFYFFIEMNGLRSKSNAFLMLFFSLSCFLWGRTAVDLRFLVGPTTPFDLLREFWILVSRFAPKIWRQESACIPKLRGLVTRGLVRPNAFVAAHFFGIFRRLTCDCVPTQSATGAQSTR